MHRLHALKDELIDELCEYGEHGVTKENLHEIDTLAHAAKNVCKIIDHCEEDSGGRYYGRRGKARMGWYISRDEGTAEPEPTGHAHNEQVIGTLENYLRTDADERTKGRIRELIRDMRNA